MIGDRAPCSAYDGIGWVCEAHSHRPMNGPWERACTCGMPGMACPVCNTEELLRHLPPGTTVTLDAKGPRQ
jgi:hypothetical protein